MALNFAGVTLAGILFFTEPQVAPIKMLNLKIQSNLVLTADSIMYNLERNCTGCTNKCNIWEKIDISATWYMYLSREPY